MLVARNRLRYEGDTPGEIRDDQRPVASRLVFPGPQLALACPGPNGFKLSGNRHQPEDDLGQRREPGGLAVLAGLVAASGALGFSFVAASRAARDEVAVPGDLGGQVGGELVKERRGKSIRSR